jgi:methylmalonyl-CoA/ethylmalonyl-CoA epimerase
VRKNTTAKSPFSKLAHVGIVVRDMDKAVERLESLGIGPFKAISLPPATEKPLLRGKPYVAKVKGLIGKIGEVEIELFQPIEGESPHKEFLDSKGEGIHHIAFGLDDVDDFDKEVAKLTEQGASVVLGGRWQGGGSAYFDSGVGGIILELIQGWE